MVKMTDAAKNWYFHTDFPHTDEDGWVWLDPTGYDCDHNDNHKPGLCFMCGKKTNRVDVNFMTFFCNSFECNEQIIEGVGGVSYSRLDMMEWEGGRDG